MPDRIHLFYLDRYHLEPLFIQTLARSITSAGADKRPAPRGLFVHGSGERAERMLEGEGFDVHRTQGVLEVHSAQEARIVHRAVVETNRAIAAILTNTVVPAVGLRGYDRHLIVDRPGGLEVQAPEWLLNLVRSGVYPVVSAQVLDEGAETARDVDPVEVSIRLSRALGANTVRVVMFTRTNRTGILRDGEYVKTLGLESLEGSEEVADPEALRRFVEGGLLVLLTGPAALKGENGPFGTLVVT